MKPNNDKNRRVPKTARKPRKKASPLDVEGIDLGVMTDEIVNMIREGRERYG